MSLNKILMGLFVLFCVTGFYMVSASSGSFTSDDLENLIKSNTNGTIDLPANKVISFKHSINISKQLKINGNGLSIKNNNMYQPYFMIDEHGCLTLSNITFDGSTDYTLKVFGSLTCDNCVFSKCTGGSIDIRNGSVNLTGSSIKYGDGSCSQINIRGSSAGLSVYNCEFSNNNNTIKDSYGSCVSSFGKVICNISNSSFKENTASWGGALSFKNSYASSDIKIQDCNITNNFANISGGFLYTDGDNYYVKLINNTFNGNIANLDKENNNINVGYGACIIALCYPSSCYSYDIEDNFFNGNNDKHGNSVLTLKGTAGSPYVYGRRNVIDGSGFFSDYVYLWDCRNANLDIEN
jgi:hypothetical protein